MSTYWYGFEVNGKYLGKAQTTEVAIHQTFKEAGMTYVILPNKLVSIYGMKKIPGARSQGGRQE